MKDDFTTGDKIKEFEAIYNHYYVPVYRFFAKRLRTRELCEDLAGDVFYSCLKAYDRYDPAKASVGTWVYSVANNRLKNYYRDKKESLSIDDEDNPIDIPDGTDMEGAVYLSQMKTHLHEALETVSDKERKIVSLRYFSGLSSAEIAAETGVTEGNVRVILSRTLVKLAEYFKKNGIGWDFDG